MSDIGDDDLRARFDALRDHDRSGTPEFGQLLANAERPHSAARSRGRGARLLLAAASIAIAAVLLAQLWDRGARPRSVETTAITGWQSPTAGFLQTPAQRVLAPLPLLSSVFDGVATTRIQTTTD